MGSTRRTLHTDEVGEVTLFVPVVGRLDAVGEVFVRELPPVELAVAVHQGALREADRTYAPLGTHVVERAIAVSGPIRESYLITSDDVGDEEPARNRNRLANISHFLGGMRK